MKKIYSVGIIVLLLASMVSMIVPTIAEEEPELHIIEVIQRDQNIFEKLFRGFWIYGESDLKTGTRWLSTNPPKLEESTEFSKGKAVQLLITMRSVQNGATIVLKQCGSSGCQPFKIFYGSGEYSDRMSFSGDYDLTHIRAAFVATETGTFEIRLYDLRNDYEKIKDRHSYTVKGLLCTPNSKTCQGGHVKICNSAGTAWSYQTCFYGCTAGTCNPKPVPTPTPKPTQVCTPYTYRCTGSNLERCNGHGTSYDYVTTCQYGCSNAQCNPPSQPTPTPAPYPTPSPTNGVIPTPTPSQEYQPLLTPGFEAMFAVIGMLIVAFLIMRKRK